MRLLHVINCAGKTSHNKSLWLRRTQAHIRSNNQAGEPSGLLPDAFYAAPLAGYTGHHRICTAWESHRTSWPSLVRTSFAGHPV